MTMTMTMTNANTQINDKHLEEDNPFAHFPDEAAFNAQAPNVESVVAPAETATVLADHVMPADGSLYVIPLARIRRNPKIDPRQHRNKADYDSLCASIKAQGVIQPIVVRLVERDDHGADLEVVAGNTRFDGSNDVALKTIPALVRHIDAKEAAIIAGIENLERQDLSPVEEGIHAARLLTSLNNDHDEVMKVLDWSRTKLNSRIMLTHVTEFVQNALVQKELKIGHVELLASVPKNQQDRIAARIIESGYTVTETKEKLSAGKRQLARACFDLSDCNGCQFNSSTSADLFASSKDMEKEFCSNAGCWDEKTKNQLNIIVTDASENFGTVHLATDVPDDSYTLLEATGENGVGADQQTACASCEHYGAVVSTVFGSEGKVREGICFNLECHGQKVTAYRNVLQQATTAPAPTAAEPTTADAENGKTTGHNPGSGADAAAKNEDQKGAPAPKEAAPITPATLKKGIKREAMKRFQFMGTDAIESHTTIGLSIAVLTLFATFKPHTYPEDVVSEAQAVMNALRESADLKPAINPDSIENDGLLLARHSVEDLNQAMVKLAALTTLKSDNADALETFPAVRHAMIYAEATKIDRDAHLSFTAEYRKAQTKPGLIQDCLKSGFAAAYDAANGEDAFSTLSKGKAGDLITAIEGFPASSFDWRGYEPLGFAPEFYG
jgi:PRTRC genetic system ParB family protein